ncbi:hypothetical protein A3F08_01310 [Candidatus Berkelbacteria bacterium RIFCSPHIGHO2_12_FULL_36_9]|uniref:Uncharacterized protein n=1 Tax=Candidatus Berkelbacteria bacterium RIFCSPHIGHO2_12_FULL_36_9 TaxID=1797469 RepID=A0A1F5EFR8_9BACT|nr:MAG: hypothetical protein A3F08_01310 [Candidatus Berkelbacteria bacterium RIFCSPHIGHO2_12_FULL_36_9]
MGSRIIDDVTCIKRVDDKRCLVSGGWGNMFLPNEEIESMFKVLVCHDVKKQFQMMSMVPLDRRDDYTRGTIFALQYLVADKETLHPLNISSDERKSAEIQLLGEIVDKVKHGRRSDDYDTVVANLMLHLLDEI